MQVCIDNNDLGTFKTYGMITELLLKLTITQVDMEDFVNYPFILYIHGFLRVRADHCYHKANCFLGVEICLNSKLDAYESLLEKESIRDVAEALEVRLLVTEHKHS